MNIARRINYKLLSWAELLTELKTGKRCMAKFSPCFNIGIGYHKHVGENGTSEFYLLPFTKVSIFTPHVWGAVSSKDGTND